MPTESQTAEAFGTVALWANLWAIMTPERRRQAVEAMRGGEGEECELLVEVFEQLTCLEQMAAKRNSEALDASGSIPGGREGRGS